MVTKLLSEAHNPLNFRASSSSRALLCVSKLSSSQYKCFCNRDNDSLQPPSQNKKIGSRTGNLGPAISAEKTRVLTSFCALGEDVPWESESIWSTLGFYLFTLHIPLSFGWKSMAVALLQKPDLDPQTQAVCLLAAQSVELVASVTLLKLTSKPGNELADLFKPDASSKGRNWLLASVIGFGFLSSLVFVTSFALNAVIEHKSMSNPIVKEMLVGTGASKTACLLVYCTVAPLLEEAVYRGFLLRSLSSTMKWQNAVLVSSLVFSLAHFSGENFVQLFVVGCVLGCSYCWSGNLLSSFAIHSLYNSITLVLTFFFMICTNYNFD